MDALGSYAVPAGIKVAFCCIGNRDPHGVSKAEFVKVDVEYPRVFARICKAAGVRHFSLCSAVNASPKGLTRYARTKAKAEAAVKEAGVM